MLFVQIAAVCQYLRDEISIRPPSSSCLSPAGIQHKPLLTQTINTHHQHINLCSLCLAFTIYSLNKSFLFLIQLTSLRPQKLPPPPQGEYNLRLGVLKELKPRLVATFTDRPGVHLGHPFLVEAAVSLGGRSIREGINVFRFANRIPLLFETGADVVTQVAMGGGVIRILLVKESHLSPIVYLLINFIST
jgi:hypothetical protein